MLQLHFTCRELALPSTVFVRRNESSSRLSRKIGWSTTTAVKRGMVHGEPAELDFPLRQRHIADATGLTPVHVSKVLSEFRRSGLIRLSERSLTILDLTGFRRIANMR